jgi:hypothetical protein
MSVSGVEDPVRMGCYGVSIGKVTDVSEKLRIATYNGPVRERNVMMHVFI